MFVGWLAGWFVGQFDWEKTPFIFDGDPGFYLSLTLQDRVVFDIFINFLANNELFLMTKIRYINVAGIYWVRGVTALWSEP